MTCNKCRAYNERKDAEFCGKCGAKLEPPRYVKTAKVLKWGGIVVGVWFAWGFIVSPFFGFVSGQFSQPNTNSLAVVGESMKPATTATHRTAAPSYQQAQAPQPQTSAQSQSSCTTIRVADYQVGIFLMNFPSHCVMFTLNANEKSPWINVRWDALNLRISTPDGHPFWTGNAFGQTSYYENSTHLGDGNMVQVWPTQDNTTFTVSASAN